MENNTPTSIDAEIIKPIYKDSKKDIEVYSEFLLYIYDGFVLSFCCPFIWGCSKSKILALYNQNISDNHLDIGVGTGYFLDKCLFKNNQPNITLLDLSQNCLQTTAKRIARYQPEILLADIFEPLPIQSKFDSVGLNYLLHCLPGSIYDKAKMFDNLIPHLNPGCRIFGATVLGKDIKLGFIAKKLMSTYNKHDIFCNREDDLIGLQEILNKYFKDVTIQLSGTVALFSAKY